MSGGRFIRAMRAKAIQQSRARVGKIAVPHFVGAFGQRQTGHFPPAGWIEHAKLDLRGVGRKHGEVHAQAVPGRSQEDMAGRAAADRLSHGR